MNFLRILICAGATLLAASCLPVEEQSSAAPVLISMTRTPCFGFCPAYTVSITGDGQVTYLGQNFVNVAGEQHAAVSPADVQGLLRRFDAIHFEQLSDSYRAHVTDLPTTTITLERNGHRKSVEDYGGVSVGMPEAVRDLQNEIDRIAGTSRWVLRDGQPVRTPRPQP